MQLFQLFWDVALLLWLMMPLCSWTFRSLQIRPLSGIETSNTKDPVT